MKHISSRRAGVRLVAVVAAAAVSAFGGVAAAEAAPRKSTRTATMADVAGAPPAGFASWAALAAAQTDLYRQATRLQRATGGQAGFTGIELAVSERRINLFWHGGMSRSTAAKVAALAPRAEVRSARYSARQLRAAATKLTRAGTVDGARVVRLAAATDGSALEVGVSGAVTGARAASATRTAGVALRVGTGRAADPAYHRLDDSPPFWGGSRVHNATRGGRCTAGFGIRSRSSGATGLLFAAHCGENGDRFTTPTGRHIGYATAKVASADTMVIPVSAGGRIYVGGTTSSASFPVTGAGYSFAGQWICTSGSFSGTRCAIQVVRTNEWVNITGIGWVYPLVRAEQYYRQNAVGQGDSGGPAFADEGNRARALGTNTAIDGGTQVACTGEGNRICAWRMWYADVPNALVRHNSTIITG
ncbi:hypothetical protein [Pilimelia terevasa]|nr:hypothetical protein [Pilimelia terevasa]